ncbi:MAG: hypothetical protein JSV08_01920 [Acidobacteriota bacterium]|nr:MAG: hypothetical protein JSV08_01920 [Acidobacteriota bacterium]
MDEKIPSNGTPGRAEPAEPWPAPDEPSAPRLVRRTPTKAIRSANRRNARRSTGPRSERGKATASANAIRHGVLARPVLTQGFLARDGVLRSALADESADEFRALLDRLNEALAPRDALDAMLVEKMALALWRYRRLRRFERSKVDWEISFRELCVAKEGFSEARKPGMAEGRAERRLLPDEETLQRILRYEAALEREWMRCYALLEQRRQQRESDDPPPLHSILRIG